MHITICWTVCAVLWAGAVGAGPKPLDELFANPRPKNAPTPTTPIARINNAPISREEFLEAVYDSAGTRVLRQLVALAAARQLAETQGVTVTDQQIRDEFDTIVNEMTPTIDSTGRTLSSRDRQKILRLVLSRRGIGVKEFDLGVKRQAYLRAVARKKSSVTEKMLRDEYDRTFGPRREVSAIVVPQRRLAQEILGKLHAGESFAALTRKYSTHTASAPLGGKLGTFAANDPNLPALVVDVAFKLKPSAISSPVKVDNDYWLVRVDKLLPATGDDFNAVKAKLKNDLTPRVERQLMEQLERETLLQSDIKIYDKQLKAEFRTWIDAMKGQNP